MLLKGLECMNDSFKRNITYLRVSVTDLCNLRCRYCMPEEGVCKAAHREMLSVEEMKTAFQVAADIGIKKIRLTGGEPLVKRGIVDICRSAAQTKGIEEVCMTTNGILLPEYAAELKKAGVRRLNISLDTLNPEKYASITRWGKLQDALDGIDAAVNAGFDKIKLNAVLIGGFNDDEIPQLANLTRTLGVDMRFIEMMPMYDGGDFDEKAFIPYTVVLDKLPELRQVDKDGSVAKLYKFDDAKGNIGLISPVSDHFCSECNRIRLTADGKIKPCLHSEKEYSIKGMDYDEMKKTFIYAIGEKPEKHARLSYTERSDSNRNMNEIGG